MGSVVTLPLSNIVDVSVEINPQSPATPTFNQGLVIGTSPVIGSVTGENPRLRQYSSLAQMTQDGFSVNSPEYIAAGIYFSQSPAPQFIWIGRQDLTALGALIPHAANAGNGYAVGDLVGVTQAGAQLGVAQVSTIGANGAVTALVPAQGQQGTGYAVGNGLATTTVTGVGVGLEVDITAIGESALEAIQACRLASPQWYLAVCLAALDADHIAIGEWAQSQQPQLVYFYTTTTAASLNGTAGNVFSVLKAAAITRAFGLYATTQNGLAANNIYAAVAAMGVAMGLNTGLAGSYFTMKFKQLVGITPEPLTQTQVNVIEGNNGNLYVNYANAYSFLEQGTVASGSYFDEILNLDMLASDYQYSVVDLLTSQTAITNSDIGQTQLLNAVNGANSRAAARGFLAPGIWSGATILNLSAGQALPNGYLAQSPARSTQSQSDRTARKALPIYVALIEAGAVHSLTIGVYVQQ